MVAGMCRRRRAGSVLVIALILAVIFTAMAASLLLAVKSQSDALDISLVPGCVSAEPNGMSYEELRDTLIGLAEHTDVIGFDLVEVNPQLDVGTGVTSYLGAHLVVEFLGQICDQSRWRSRRDR